MIGDLGEDGVGRLEELQMIERDREADLRELTIARRAGGLVRAMNGRSLLERVLRLGIADRAQEREDKRGGPKGTQADRRGTHAGCRACHPCVRAPERREPDTTARLPK